MPVAVQERGDQQQRRPQKRVMVPFPEDAPKEPNRDQLRGKIDGHRSDASGMKERIDEIRAKLAGKKADPVKEALQKEKQELIAKRKELDQETMEKIKQRDAVQDRLKAARVSTRETEKEVRELNKELRDFKSVEDVNKRIKELEFRIETSGSGSLNSHKRIMQEIKGLEQQRGKVSALDIKLKDIQAKSRDVAHVGGNQTELQRAIDELRDQKSDLNDQIDGKSKEIAGRNDQTEAKAMMEERNDLQKKISDIYAKIDGMRAKFDEEKKVYDEFRVEHKKKEDAAWEKFRADQAAERQQRDDERKVKQLEIASIKRLNPHEEEITICKSLIEYLQAKVKTAEVEEKKKEATKSYDPTAVAAGKGFAMSGKTAKDRKKEEFFVIPKKQQVVVSKRAPGPTAVPAAAKPEAPKEPAAPKSRPINHQFPKFEAFSKVGVKIPMSTDHVGEATKLLREKLAHYQTFIKTEKEAMEEERIAQEKAAAEKKKKEAERLEKEAAEAAAEAQATEKADETPAADPEPEE